MKKILPAVLMVAIVAVAVAFTLTRTHEEVDPLIAVFHEDADRLIEGLQRFKEFVKAYPSGELADIARALSGESQKDRILVLATSRNKKNARGEIVDPWGTPVQFYFADNGVVVRSAGPNRVFEDSQSSQTDDLFRTDVKK
jgi:hypothetical protein